MNRARSVLTYIAIVERITRGEKITQAERAVVFKVSVGTVTTYMNQTTKVLEEMNRRERARRFREAVGV